MALPGPGFGVGTVWRVRGEEVEVRMRARWVSGRLSGAIAWLGLMFGEGLEGWLMLGICGGWCFSWGCERQKG